MKIKALSISTILGFLGVILAIHSFNVKAASPNIKCSTAFGEKNLVIEDKSVSYLKDDLDGQSRSISSTNESSVTTLKTHQGFVKTLYIEGNKHQIKVNNTKAFSETDDYLTITSPKGHKMTYPLNCRSA